MLKVAIVGCGRIADAHASQIRRIAGCEIVAACDRERLMARQLCDRFSIRGCFSDLGDLLDDARPDVVHVTTPPASHFQIAKVCLEHGCHVYVEKPFTLCLEEAETLIALANRKGIRITAGHDDQFSHAARRMRALARSGYLGGAPVHMESWYCYDLTDPAYAKALLSDARHWVRSLPGGLMQNVISHGIARIAEFLSTDSPRVIAYGFVSPLLRRLGERDIIDELRVIVCEEERTTAYFTFSSQMRPSIHQFRIYGPKNGLVLDQDHDTVLTLRGARFKSYGDKFIPPLVMARQHVTNFATNARTFLRRDFHMKSGMKYLIESFYRSIVEDGPAPIPSREILLTARIMDEIFDQLRARDSCQPPAGQLAASSIQLLTEAVSRPV
jgi:predicted dehydrogenase